MSSQDKRDNSVWPNVIVEEKMFRRLTAPLLGANPVELGARALDILIALVSRPNEVKELLSVRNRAQNSCRHTITQVLSPITSMANGFSIRTAHPQEAGVICCAGLSIVAGVARRQSGRSGHHRPMWTARRCASKARPGAFHISDTPAF
jgi:hypothetical protein